VIGRGTAELLKPVTPREMERAAHPIGVPPENMVRFASNFASVPQATPQATRLQEISGASTVWGTIRGRQRIRARSQS
jgi:hypothetical protein